MKRSSAIAVRRLGGLAATLLILLLGGCGSGIYPVEGQVVWKDGSSATELAGSNVIFEGPETSAVGSIRPDATFRLTTNQPDDGAPAGDYKVLVIEVGRKSLPGGDGSMLAPGVIDSRYADPSTSGLTATVKPGTNQVTLTVERNPELAQE
jgi:hypothetical protein